MSNQTPDHALEFLLGFDGRVHHLEEGYWLKFEIKRVAATGERPHGLSYSFTLHAPDGTRLVGYDNAHVVPAKGSRFRRRETRTITGIARRTTRADPTGSRTQKR